MRTQKDANGTYRSTVELSAMLGAGKLVAALWRSETPVRGSDYSFNVFHMEPDDGSVSQRFTAEDVFSLAKLALVLAYAILHDEAVDQDLRDDLDCFASCLDGVFPSVRDNVRC